MAGNNPEGNAHEGPVSIDDAVSLLAGSMEPEGTTDEPESETVADEEETEAMASDEEVSEETDADEEVYEDADEDDDEDGELLLEIKGQQITLAEVEKSMMQHKDYTEKTQAMAVERKQMADMQASIAAERQHLAQMLEAAQKAPQDEPDWVQLANDDPLEYTRLRAIHEATKAEQDAMTAERQRLAQQEQVEQQQNLQRYVQAEQAKMVEAIPELGGENAAQVKAAAGTYMQGIGYTAQELEQLFDHRVVVMAHDARQWRELQAKSKTAAKKVKGKAKVIRPGAKKGKSAMKADQRMKGVERLRKSGSVEDAVALLTG